MGHKFAFAFSLAALLPLAGLSGCTWETDLPDAATSVHVEPSRELLVTDQAVVAGPLADNRTEGPLSFRHAMSRLGLAPGATVRWLDGWSARLAAEGSPDRARAFDLTVTCPWLKARPENLCDETCGQCAAREVDLAVAPFRLTAVVNRTDLSVMPDRAAGGGEGRLVFSLRDGAMSVIFEYAQIGDARSWASAWHALGDLPAADFPAHLAELTETFVAKGSLSIAQIRTADAFTGPMVLHQFQLTAGEIVAGQVRNTPDFRRVDEPSLRSFTSEHAAELEGGTAVLPQAWWAAGSALGAPVPAYLSSLPEHEPLVRGTCAGCHALSADGFHVGSGKLSTFLVDGTKPSDEVRRRIAWTQLVVSGLATP